MPYMFLDGVPLKVNPDDIRWNFKMKTTDSKTMGGKVIQVLGTRLDDLTIQGQFSPDRAKGDTEAWQSQIRFRAQVEKWADRAANTENTNPLRFTYPPRNWEFKVYIKSISGIDWAIDAIAPRWTMVLFPMDDRATAIVKGIKDLYLKRLTEGVGWKQTEYNGPTQTEVDNMLSQYSGSASDYLLEQGRVPFEQGLSGERYVPGEEVAP